MRRPTMYTMNLSVRINKCFHHFFTYLKFQTNIKLWSSDFSVTHFTAGLFFSFPQFFVTTIYIFIFQLLNLPTCGAF